MAWRMLPSFLFHLTTSLCQGLLILIQYAYIPRNDKLMSDVELGSMRPNSPILACESSKDPLWLGHLMADLHAAARSTGFSNGLTKLHIQGKPNSPTLIMLK